MHQVEKIYDRWIEDESVLNFFLLEGKFMKGYLVDYTEKEFIFRSMCLDYSDEIRIKIIMKAAIAVVEVADY